MPGISVSSEFGKGIGERGEDGGVVRRGEDDDRQVQALFAELGGGGEAGPVSPSGPSRTWLDSVISFGSRPISWQWA